MYLLLPPVFLVGFVANVPTALVVTAVSKGASRAYKDEATVKLLLGAIAFPLTWLVSAISKREDDSNSVRWAELGLWSSNSSPVAQTTRPRGHCAPKDTDPQAPGYSKVSRRTNASALAPGAPRGGDR